MGVLEKDIEKYLRQEVIKRGGRAIKLTSSNLRALPDRLCLFPGEVTIFVEVKAPGRKPSVNQSMMMDELRRLGYTAVWLDSRPRVDALMKWLEENKCVTLRS